MKYTLLISDEASGRTIEKVINPMEKILVVPYKKMKKEHDFINELKGRSFTHLKINATLNKDEIRILMTGLIPIIH